jgi:hypothetical protein
MALRCDRDRLREKAEKPLRELERVSGIADKMHPPASSRQTLQVNHSLIQHHKREV